MRYESSVTSISWIPLDAVRGLPKLPFEVVAHYDLPPPDVLTDLGGLLAADAFRFANELNAWIEVEDGRIVRWGRGGKGHVGVTTLRVGPTDIAVPAVQLPDLAPEPDVTDTSLRVVQTAGGRTGIPSPRRVRRPPFVQITSPLAWTTLAITLRSDGSSEFEVVGASPFPRHWIYGSDGRLAAKSGLIDFESWYREAYGGNSPWGGRESEALVMGVESALERELSRIILGEGAPPPIRSLATSETLVEQGATGDEIFVLFDGVLGVEIDGEAVTEVGPGSILGEMALLEGGIRRATLRARTPCRIVTVPGDRVDPTALAEVTRTRARAPGSPPQPPA